MCTQLCDKSFDSGNAAYWINMLFPIEVYNNVTVHNT